MGSMSIGSGNNWGAGLLTNVALVNEAYMHHSVAMQIWKLSMDHLISWVELMRLQKRLNSTWYP